jgi:hypothetical protein
MPDHFQLVVWHRGDGDPSDFMRWLTLTHTQRRHAHHHTAGAGHAYHGRFKSFPVQSDQHFLTVCNYLKRNAPRAGLAARAEAWSCGSLWRHEASDASAEPRLSPWPIERPSDWTLLVNPPTTPVEGEAVRRSTRRGQPSGTAPWQARRRDGWVWSRRFDRMDVPATTVPALFLSHKIDSCPNLTLASPRPLSSGVRRLVSGGALDRAVSSGYRDTNRRGTPRVRQFKWIEWNLQKIDAHGLSVEEVEAAFDRVFDLQ